MTKNNEHHNSQHLSVKIMREKKKKSVKHIFFFSIRKYHNEPLTLTVLGYFVLRDASGKWLLNLKILWRAKIMCAKCTSRVRSPLRPGSMLACMISAVWDIHLDQYMKLNKQKEGKFTDLQAKIKNSLCHICFVHKMEKISLFGLTSGHKRSCDSATQSLIFANLVSKHT